MNTINEREIANNYIKAWVENKTPICTPLIQNNHNDDDKYLEQINNFSSNKRIHDPASFDYPNDQNSRSKRICY